jgi:hypothetical protein
VCVGGEGVGGGSVRHERYVCRSYGGVAADDRDAAAHHVAVKELLVAPVKRQGTVWFASYAEEGRGGEDEDECVACDV